MAVRRKLFRGGGLIGLLSAALIAAVSVAPAGATPGPTVTYNTGVTLDCVLSPTSLAIEDNLPVSITANGPAYVENGDSFSLTNSESALTTPADWSTSFASLGAKYVAGDVTNFPLDASNGSPSSINAAAAAPFNALNVMNFNVQVPTTGGEGLPLGPLPVVSGEPLNLNIPVTTSPITITSTGKSYDAPTGTPTSFNVGPFTVTGPAGQSSVLSIDTSPAFSTDGAGDYTVFPGEGIVSNAAGYADSTLNLNTSHEKTAGPLGVYCNAPTNNLGSVPIVAPATVTNPSAASVASGATATFSVTTGGTPAATVQWQVSTDGGVTWNNDTTDSGNTTTTLSVVGSSANNGDEYRAEATNAVTNPAATPPGPYTIATANSTGAKLTVAPPPCTTAPSVGTQPSSVTVTSPNSASFTVAEGTVPANCSAATIQWQSAPSGSSTFSNISGATSATLTINPTSVGISGTKYRAVLTNGGGSTDSNAATLTVNPPPCTTAPSVGTQPSSVTVTSPNSASFTVAEGTVPANCSAATIQWQSAPSGSSTFSNISGATSATLTINPTSVAISGTQYRAVLTNGGGSTDSNAATLTVNPPPCTTAPSVGTQPSSVTVTSPNSASFTVAEGTVPANCSAATIQWQSAPSGSSTFSNISGATSATLTINPTSVSISGTKYRAVLTNGGGSTDSNAATLTVNPPPCTTAPSVGTQPSSVTVTAPTAASFTVAEGTVPANCSAATIQWQVAPSGSSTFSNISGATSATLSVSPTAVSESGNQYRAVLTNGGGSTDSNAATLTVNPTPCTTAPSVGTQPSSVTVTAPASASFTVAEGTVPANCSAATIQWQSAPSGSSTFSNISGATSATLTINPTSVSISGTKYRAVLTNGGGSTDSNAATLTVNPTPCTTAPSVGTQPTSVSVTAPTAASFTVAEGTVPANCSAATIQWQSAPSGSSTFSNISGATSATLTISPTTVSESGNQYRAVLTNGGGSTDSNAATLTVAPTPCTTAPSVGTQPSSVTVTAPASASFTVAEGTVPANCSAATIQWQSAPSGSTTFSNISGATSATLTINPTSVGISGTKYRAVLTNGGGSTDSNAATLTVNPTPCTTAPSVGTQPTSVSVTAPAAATFTVAEGTVPANCSAATIQWQVAPSGSSTFSNISGATSATLSVSPTTVSESGNQYRAVLTNGGGSTDSNAATLTVAPTPCTTAPSVGTQPSSVTVTAPASASFTVAEGTVPANCSAATIQWQSAPSGSTTFSNISGATSATLTINPTSVSISGTQYRAVLTNGGGSTDSNAATLTVNPGCTTAPSVGTQPTSVTVTAPAAATFTVAEGTVPANCSAATIQWQVAPSGSTTFSNISGATSATLSVSPTTVSESGNQYRAVLTNGGGSTDSNAATLTVTAPPCATAPAITTQPTSVTVTAPNAASFTVAGSTPANCSAPTIQWQSAPSGSTTFTDVSGATSATLTISPTATTQSGTEYRAVLTNSAGSTDSNAATLTVNAVASNAPTVTKVTPNSGGSFSLVFITGTNFSHTHSVQFGTRPAFYLQLSTTVIVALAPPAPAGTVDVTVTTSVGTSAKTSADHFTYNGKTF